MSTQSTTNSHNQWQLTGQPLIAALSSEIAALRIEIDGLRITRDVRQEMADRGYPGDAVMASSALMLAAQARIDVVNAEEKLRSLEVKLRGEEATVALELLNAQSAGSARLSDRVQRENAENEAPPSYDQVMRNDAAAAPAQRQLTWHDAAGSDAPASGAQLQLTWHDDAASDAPAQRQLTWHDDDASDAQRQSIWDDAAASRRRNFR